MNETIVDGAEYEAKGLSTGLEDLSDNLLLDAAANLMGAQHDLAQSRERFEYEIHRRMEASGATVMTHSRFDEVALKEEATYDQLALAPLLDLLDPASISHAWDEPWQEVVEHKGKWSISKTRPLVKLGGGIRTTIEGARRVTGTKLTLKLAKENTNA
jgi:hypothetical protein